jgi:hypothetical protein
MEQFPETAASIVSLRLILMLFRLMEGIFLKLMLRLVMMVSFMLLLENLMLHGDLL